MNALLWCWVPICGHGSPCRPIQAVGVPGVSTSGQWLRARLFGRTKRAIPKRAPTSVQRTPSTTIVSHEGKRELVPRGGGLVPRLWSKKVATFNARTETKPFFCDAFKCTRCLIPVGVLRVVGHTGQQAALVLHCARWCTCVYRSGPVGPVARQGKDARHVRVRRELILRQWK